MPGQALERRAAGDGLASPDFLPSVLLLLSGLLLPGLLLSAEDDLLLSEPELSPDSDEPFDLAVLVPASSTAVETLRLSVR